MNWLKRIFKRPSLTSFQVVAPEFENWTAEDCAMLRVFFLSPTGQKFYKVCLNKSLNEAMAECVGDRATKVAGGMDALLRFQQNLCSEKVEQELISRSTSESVENQNAETRLREAELSEQ